MRLVTGNCNYSSWSMRAWLFLKCNGLDFQEQQLALFEDGWAERVLEYSPSGRVPVLHDDDVAVWDTLAIFEYVMEHYATPVGWPASRARRAHARSIVAEMHAGFLAVRGELPQNLRRRTRLSLAQLSDNCQAQLGRIERIWCDCRERYGQGGPWLFGDFSLADIMYTPVALRLVTYGLEYTSRAAEFIAAVREHELVREWVARAQREPQSLAFIDDLVPGNEAPLTPG